MHRVRATGGKISFLKLMTLFPVANAAIEQAAEGCRRVVVAEENLTGLYASAIQPLLGSGALLRVNGIGNPISPGQILEAMERAR